MSTRDGYEMDEHDDHEGGNPPVETSGLAEHGGGHE